MKSGGWSSTLQFLIHGKLTILRVVEEQVIAFPVHFGYEVGIRESLPRLFGLGWNWTPLISQCCIPLTTVGCPCLLLKSVTMLVILFLLLMLGRYRLLLVLEKRTVTSTHIHCVFLMLSLIFNWFGELGVLGFAHATLTLTQNRLIILTLTIIYLLLTWNCILFPAIGQITFVSLMVSFGETLLTCQTLATFNWDPVGYATCQYIRGILIYSFVTSLGRYILHPICTRHCCFTFWSLPLIAFLTVLWLPLSLWNLHLGSYWCCHMS